MGKSAWLTVLGNPINTGRANVAPSNCMFFEELLLYDNLRNKVMFFVHLVEK